MDRLDPTVQLLRDLVAIDSVNPELVPGAAGEAEAGERVASELRRCGIDVHTTEVAPGRHNVVGVLEGATPGPTLMFCGHLDTVGVEGMTTPFDPLVRHGRLHGRGSQDMKSGLAAMVGAAKELAVPGGVGCGRLLVAAVVDEEFVSRGADALVRDWRADAAVVTEPTNLSIATAHKGFAWVDIETRGRAAHGSRPRDGQDAILRMGRVLGGLETIDRRLQSMSPHPLVGTPSLHACTIGGGRELSVYPDRCVLSMERRTVAGETESVAIDEVRTLLGELETEDPEFEGTATPVFHRPAYEIPASHSLVRTLGAVAERNGISSAPTGMSFWTDAAILGQAGIPSVLFGPRGEGLHGTDEYVELDSVMVCQRVLSEFAREFLSPKPHPPRCSYRTLLTTKATLAGRSASRRMKYGNQSLPNGR